MSDVIDIRFPAHGDFVVLGRMVAATVGVRAGFSIEEVEDLRLAVDELCLWALSTPGGPDVAVRFERDAEAVTVACRRTGSPDSSAPPPLVEVPAMTADAAGDQDITQQELSRQILLALVGEGQVQLGEDGPSSIRMRARGPRP
jgi:hypothetical protein